MAESVRWTRLTNSALVSLEPVLLYGVVCTISTGGAGVNIYSSGGLDAAHKVVRVQPPSVGTVGVMFTAPVKLDGGMYIELEAGVTEVTVCWTFAET